ncbi:MAG: hypothetical protein JNL28_15085 [Planctomycetes bacterium]|nr:hypothetical protein [Planctomycetota bacterium]
MTGRGGGAKSARRVRYAKNTPCANLFVSLLGRSGAPRPTFGDSTGALEGRV